MEKSKSNALKIVAIILAVAIVVAGIVVGLKYKDKFTSGSVAEVTTTEDTIEETTEAPTTEEPTTEEPTTEFDTSVYDGILDEYRRLKKEFNCPPEQRSGIKYDLSYSADPFVFEFDLMYAYKDLNGDFAKELIVAADTYEESPSILNIWKVENNEVELLRENSAYNSRSKIVPCENNIIREYKYPGSCKNDWFFYDITNINKPVFIEYVIEIYNWEDSSKSKYAHIFKDEQVSESDIDEKDYITKEEYDSIMAKYVPITDYDWQDLNY